MDLVKEEREIVPGGDLRIRGNGWLRDAFANSEMQRVPREPEFRKVIRIITDKHKLCSLPYFVANLMLNVDLMFFFYIE